MAAQASGIAMNLYQTRQAAKQLKMGARLDKEELEIGIEQERLMATEKSLMANERLRESLATTRALMAARGQAGGSGSARAVTQKSIQNFNLDEMARSISSNFKTYQAKSQQRLIDINSKNKITNLYGEAAKDIFSTVSFNSFEGLTSSSGPKPTYRMNRT